MRLHIKIADIRIEDDVVRVIAIARNVDTGEEISISKGFALRDVSADDIVEAVKSEVARDIERRFKASSLMQLVNREMEIEVSGVM